MTPEEHLVLSMIRKVVNPASALDIPEGVNWARVIDIAMRQGVLGLTFETAGLIPKDQRPDDNSLMIWYGYTNLLECKYSAHRKTIGHLADFYAQHDIKMMLLKGHGLSMNWPVPEHRQPGDIDVYLYGDWQRGDQLIQNTFGIDIDAAHEHHTCFAFESVTVENHYDFVNTKATRSGAMIEPWFKEEAFRTSNTYILDEYGCKVYLPSPDFNAVFLIRHLGQHFAGAEASLRQLLDWGFWMRKDGKNTNWDKVIPILKQIGIYDFFCDVNAICVQYLGFLPEEFPVYDSKRNEPKLLLRIMEDIFHPEFSEEMPAGNTLKAMAFKIRRFHANRWKRRLIYPDSIFSQLLHGSLAHLKRFDAITD